MSRLYIPQLKRVGLSRKGPERANGDFSGLPVARGAPGWRFIHNFHSARCRLNKISSATGCLRFLHLFNVENVRCMLSVA